MSVPTRQQRPARKWTVCSRINFSGEVRHFTFSEKAKTVSDGGPGHQRPLRGAQLLRFAAG